ncbi:histidine phosphatase family protein [Entomospira entomophila]|uniref:Histidine phosphatase family protein n=1 Tax=Entomospira entomophila TaxID=2719988 RepID=A0A968GA92_9SPIO|nr:histidine phosphatase family protein [Entomospira entomophilus]NIZ40675.1 histidine phosphatase family protein [Entomospira entomophilus]WDI34888.1 histidine phosphatase family protein [Entomospira entomophilus]
MGFCVYFLLLLSCQGGKNRIQDKHSTKEEVETIFWIVRHGKTMLNTTDRVQGWADAPLIPAGLEVVEDLAYGLADIPFVGAYSSDSGRARETAQIILDKNQQHPPTLHEDWRLREVGFGSYEGEYNHHLWEEIAQSQGLDVSSWLAQFDPKEYVNSIAKLDRENRTHENNWPAEDHITVRNRLIAVLDDLTHRHATGGNVLIVSHGLSIVTLVNALDPLLNFNESPKNASVTKVRYTPNEGYLVQSINDVSYIQHGASMREHS